MNALKAVSLRSLPLEFSITMIITETYTCKYEKKKKWPRFPSSKLSSKLHEVSPATAQKSINQKKKSK